MGYASITTRWLAAALLTVSIAGCSGDDDAAAPIPTRVTEDPRVAAKAIMCDSLQSYVDAEGRRLRNPVPDPAVVTRLEAQRAQALVTLRAALTPEAPAAVRGALDQLEALPIQGGPDTTTPPPAVDAATPLAVVTAGLDPICATEGGQATSSTLSSTSTTQASPATTASPPTAVPTTSAPATGGATSSTSRS